MNTPPRRLLRLGSIVKPRGLLPISRSCFYSWIKAGRAPRPIKLGRISIWRESDINHLIENGIGSEGSER
jgi:prophage regulatory protein